MGKAARTTVADTDTPPLFAYASREWTKGIWWRVASLPGDGGVDWGYTGKAIGEGGNDRPLLLNRYWQRRFTADMRRVGARSTLTPCVMTDVLFRATKSGQFKGEVTAVFPAEPGSPGYMSCYAHTGQHSDCSFDWYYTTRPATPDEYRSLKSELESIGYVLRTVHRVTRAHARARREAEQRD